MPVSFKADWNNVALKCLADVDLKARMLALKADALSRVDALLAARQQEVSDLQSAKGGGKKIQQERAAKLQTAKTAAEKLSEFKNKGEITAALVRELGADPKSFRIKAEVDADATLSKEELGWRIMAVNNDMKRLSDQSMLTAYGELDIRTAIQNAAQSFHTNKPPGAMIERAIALPGDAVEVTQGVHQANDPHFDVKPPGDDKQMHVNVSMQAIAPKLKIVSISWMEGGKKELLLSST